MSSDAAQPPLKVLLFGGGALGALYSSLLAQQGAHVTAVCRSNYAAVAAGGYTIKSDDWGDHTFRPARVIRGPADLPPDDSFDYVLVATKAQNALFTSPASPPPLAEYTLAPHTTIVLVQNGVGIEAPYRAAFPQNPIVSGVAYITASQPEPGVVVQNKGANRIYLGLFDRLGEAAAEATCARVVRALQAAGVDARLDEQVQRERWAKLLWNGPWNTLCAVTGLSTHAVIASGTEMRELALGIVREIAATAMAWDGIEFGEEEIVFQWTRTYEDLPTITPSMLQDARKGVEMEVEALCGNIWRRGEAKGVDCSRVKSIYSILAAMNYRFKNKL